MRLRQVDLNLLQVFDTVMKYRSVALAGEQLNLSPSAVSHALARLRHVLKDELFVRGETGMEPTQRAVELAAPVRDGLALLEVALTRAAFVPKESIRSFRLAASDYACAVILPRLFERIARAAPHIDLKILPVGRLGFSRQLEIGAVDLVIAWFDALPDNLLRKSIMRESGVFVVRHGHPLLQAPVTHERVFDFPHAVVELTGTEDMRSDGFLDDRGLVRRVWIERAVLEAQGRPDLSARVAVSVPHFTAVPPLLRVSDLIATLPLRLARLAVAQGGLVMLDPALETTVVDVEAVYHSRSDGDAGLAWLLDELRGACADVDGVTMP